MKLSDVSIWLLVVILIAGAAMGAWAEYTWGPRLTITHTIEKPIVTEKVVTQTDTQIQYVPKEVVVYRDPETGQVSEKPLDAKMIFNKPEFIFTVNGQPGKFTKADDERFVFDKNMMQLTQTSTIRVEAEIPTIDKTKNGALGVGWGSHGLAGKLDIKQGWIYWDKDTKAGGVQYRF